GMGPMWLLLRRDRGWWIFLACLGVLNTFYLVPQDSAVARVAPLLDPLVITAVVLALLAGLRDVRSAEERGFWALSAAGYGCWWLSEVLMWVFAHAQGRLGFHLLVDTLYLLLFICSLAAAELRPDLGRPPWGRWPIRPRIVTAALLLSLAGFALYFVVIPSRVDPVFYGTRVSSMMLYAALDALVALRFFLLYRIAEDRRWRWTYGLFALSMGLWCVLDASDAFMRATGFETSPAVTVVWSAPLVVLAAAVSLRRYPEAFTGDGASGAMGPDAAARLEDAPRDAHSATAVALLLPFVHAVLGTFQVTEPAFQAARDGVVAASLLGLGALALWERRLEGARRRRDRESDRENARRELERSEERFRNLAASSFEGVIIHDGHRVLDANEQLAAMFGAELHEVVGAKLGDRVAPVDKDAMRRALQEPATGEPLELRVYRKDRTPFLVEARGRNLPSLGPNVRVAVFRDLTEHRRLEKDLRQAQKMDAVGRLAGGIAHDFNNLLTVILGSCDLAEPATFDDDIRQIRAAALRAAGMTGQLMAFSRHGEIELEVFELNEILLDNEALLRRLLPASIDLALDPGADLPPIRADRSQMAQVLLNLVINGRDAMPDGGEVKVWTALEAMPAVAGGVDSGVGAATYVTLSVRDRGGGIRPADLAHIFDPFFTTKGAGEGTGLGLATVDRIVRQAGGYVEVDSRPGAGTIFRVFLPACLSEDGDGPPLDAPGLREGWGRGRIVVVDDQPEVRLVVRKVLEQAGFEVWCASSAAQVMDLVKTWAAPPTLLIADIVMPNLSGPRLAARLRERWPSLPVLFISGHSEGPWFDTVAGQPLLPKPFDRQALWTAVRSTLQGSRAD
ncbi:MAG: ATP-binding protein, partial [Acidobacteriota bacterium]